VLSSIEVGSINRAAEVVLPVLENSESVVVLLSLVVASLVVTYSDVGMAAGEDSESVPVATLVVTSSDVGRIVGEAVVKAE
jgi:hypothetical protein